MKRCENCFESNSDGATNCVICGDPLDVPQVADREPRVAVYEPGDDVQLESADVVIDPDDEETARRLVFPARTLEAVASASEEGEVLVEEIEAEPEVVEAEPVEAPAVEAPEPVGEPVPDPVPEPVPAPVEAAPPTAPTPAPPTRPALPAQGRVVLQVFHDTEPRVVHTHEIVNDITLVGREDPQRDVFPDLDLGKLPAAEVAAGRASRQHLRLLRQGDRYYLYVYKGSTGTQVCDRLVEPSSYGKRFEIAVGDRIILGGKVRMKLTRVE